MQFAKIAQQLDLPENRKTWTEDDKVRYASEGFRQGTEWLLDAIAGSRLWPGEAGEAAEYWQQVQSDEQQFIDEKRIIKYRDALIFEMIGWGGRYVDPRASLRAAKRLGMDATLTLARRENKEGWSYTLASKAKDLIERDAFRTLTKAEHKRQGALSRLNKIGFFPKWGWVIKLTEIFINPVLVNNLWGKTVISEQLGFDPWGGREAVGGSGWRTPSLLEPQEVIDALS